jgi:tetratricopeptide (TPR) repeat protein
MMWRLSPGWSAALAAVLLMLSAAPVQAAPPSNASESSEVKSKEPAEYKRVVGRAVREFDAGNYPEARALFTQAHELYPNARTFLGLGLVAFELRNYGTCVENLETALSSSVKPLNDQLRQSAQDVLGKARGMIAQLNLEVSPDPDAARVLLDGVPVALAEGQALILEVGDHVVEVQASGYLSERRALSIVGGEKLKLSVVMRQVEAAPSPAETAQAAPLAPGPHEQDDRDAKPRRWYKSPWLWVSVSVVVVAAGVTTGLLLRPDAKTEPQDPTTTSRTPPGGQLQALGAW